MLPTIIRNIVFLSVVAIATCISCTNKYAVHKQYLNDTYEKSIDTAVFVPYRKGDKFFYIDRRTSGPYAGHARAFDGEWDFAKPFNQVNHAVVKSGEMKGLIDTNGKYIIPLTRDIFTNYNTNGNIIVKSSKSKLYGILNYSGDTILDFIYDDINTNYVGNISTRKSSTYALYSCEGKVLIQPGTYDVIGYFNNLDSIGYIPYGYKVYANKYKYGYLDPDLNILTDTLYDDVSSFVSGLARVNVDGKSGFINMKGELVIPCEYRYVSLSGKGAFAVKKNDMWGIINTKGEILIPIKYDIIGFNGLYNGVIPASIEHMYGLIDTSGNIICDFKYDDIDCNDYAYGLYPAKNRDGKAGVLDYLGNELIDFKYAGLDIDNSSLRTQVFSPNRIVVTNYEEPNLMGIVNRKGEQVTPMKYSFIGSLYGIEEFGLIHVVVPYRDSKKRGYIDIFGKEYFED